MHTSDNSKSRPLVSVIVPLHNEAERLPRLLAALQNQSYPNYEVILIDNDSTDGTASLASKYAQGMTRIVFETRVRNADTARNTGIAAAQGDLLAFTDGDCLPDPQWLESAVERLVAKAADLVAGRIDFDLPKQPDSAQVYDSISFLRHSDSVEKRGVAFTANLLVTRAVVNATGGFPANVGWNGDSLFTRSATRQGYRLVYADNARVRHPVRSWKGLVQKVWRIAFSKGSCTVDHGRPARDFFLEPKPHIRHLNPYFVAVTLRENFGKAPLPRILSVVTVAWAMAAVGAAGFVLGRGARSVQ